MAYLNAFRTASALGLLSAPLAAAQAQEAIPADLPPTLDEVAPEQEKRSDWQIGVGAVALYGPAFIGSKDYQGMAAPNIEIRYKDRVFLSVLEGLGVDLIKTDRLRAGPVLSFEQKRQEDGNNSLVLIGDKTRALRGLGDTKNTVLAGAFVEYEVFDSITAKARIDYGINGNKGLTGKFSLEYMAPLGGLTNAGQPIMFGFGPQTTVVNNKWNDTFFGISPTQSANSGLREFNAKGGVLSYGVNSKLIVPVTSRISGAVFVSYDRLTGDAAKSPLVRERGSKNQANIGLGLTYRFGRPGRPPRE